MTMKKRVLLSIHPEHAEAILDGRKDYEFRKVLFKQQVGELVLYATSPVCRVIGTVEVHEIVSASPADVWEKAQYTAGVTVELFQQYFAGRAVAHAIKVRKPLRFSRPKPLSMYLKSNFPPQSFCYL
jgi:predicted transcriptional regulator